MLLHNFIFAREDRVPVDLDVLYFESKFFGPLEVIVNVGMVEEDFGGNATDVQAGSAEERVFLNDGHFQAPLRGANRGHVAARTAANHHEIVFIQASSPLQISRYFEPFDARKGHQD